MKLRISAQVAVSALLLSFVAGARPVSAQDPIDANIFVNLAKKVVPSVVNISTVSTVKAPFGGGMGPGTPDDLFRRFFEDFFRQHGGAPRGGDGNGDEDDDNGAPPPALPGKPGHGQPKSFEPKAMSLGTGFIIDANGLILTNNHVVADAEKIKINFTEEADEKPTDGEVVGRDPELDIALIKVKTDKQLAPLSLGDSEALEVGEYVIAVGNPFGQGHSVTHGIISAKSRPAPDFPLATYLQTDAPINPGNSGGPLVNLKGEVIGINNAIDQRAQGIGFAIPSSLVKKILPQLKSKGVVSRGYIGVMVNEITPEIASKLGVPKDTRAPFVTNVYPGEPADKAGLKPYDVILEVGGKKIRSSADLINAVTAVPVGESTTMKISRAGEEKTLTIKVAQRPGSQPIPLKQRKGGKKKETQKKPPVETGMTLEDVTPQVARELGAPEKLKGVIITEIAYGSPADVAGLGRGDVIVEVDRKPVKDVETFYSIVREKKSYLLRVRRPDPQGGEVFSVILLDLREQKESK